MAIRQFIKCETGPAEIDRLNDAYAKTLRMLDLVDRDDPVTDLVAKKVVDIGTSGVIDPEEIAHAVVRHFLER